MQSHNLNGLTAFRFVFGKPAENKLAASLLPFAKACRQESIGLESDWLCVFHLKQDYGTSETGKHVLVLQIS